MEQTAFTNLRDLVRAFARAMNLISPEVANHHEKVALLAGALAEELQMSSREQQLAFFGALLHDIGAVTLSGNRKLALAEVESNAAFLAKAGSALLRMNPVTAQLSDVVFLRQSPWRALRGSLPLVGKKWMLSQVVHLADTVSLLLEGEETALNRVGYIRECIRRTAGYDEYCPEVLEAFESLCRRDDVWLYVRYHPECFLRFVPADKGISLDETIRITELIGHVIDFRSPFTAMHSAGVAASAETLAELAGMSRNECKMMRVAGSLHDLGKLKIPKEILEKPGKLTDEEFNTIKEHAYFTYMLLKDIQGFEQIAVWAAFHHEKLNGRGYPFRLEGAELPLGARIMAVSDIFSAITEDRPYRRGMEREQAVRVLRENAAAEALSGNVTELLIANFDAVNAARERASREAGKRYYASIQEKQLPEGQEAKA